MKKYKGRIITAAFVIFLLVFAFMLDEEPAEERDGGTDIVTSVFVENTTEQEIEGKKEEELIEENEPPKANITDVQIDIVDPVSTEVVEDIEPELTCTMSVHCESILKNLEKFKPEKRGLVPEDGVIYHAQIVEFKEGETAFDLLLREMRKNNIHMEFIYTPAFDSTYIEGIGNIYEFDCGDMSGWLYKVNGIPANCGSSQYILCPGDIVEWVYTCG